MISPSSVPEHARGAFLCKADRCMQWPVSQPQLGHMVAKSKMKAHEAYKEWKSDPSVSRTLSLISLQYVPQMRKLFEAKTC